MSDELDALIHEAADWLRIPSISAGARNEPALREAADWALRRVRSAGGTCELVDTPGGAPLVVGELRAASADAPTVLIYGHYDVQAVGDPAAWTSPAFSPEVRDGRVYARGAADDKGNFLPLLHVACAQAAAGSLPVNVRVFVEGEEEIGSPHASDWIREDARGADCAIVFDSGMVDADTPAITVGLRGLVQLNLEVSTGERDLHSGSYGGSALNALHALHAMLGAVLPGPDGRLREELRAGILPVDDVERESWAALPPGQHLLRDAGARPLYPDAGADYYERNGADAALDVNAIHAGEPRTVIPAVARATVTQRLAPGQRAAEIKPVLERLLRDAAPAGAEVSMTSSQGDPALFGPETPAIALAASAIERACGTAPLFVRVGGSIPVVAEFGARGIPTIVSGFVVEADAFHAPNESYRLVALEQGEAAARELYAALASL